MSWLFAWWGKKKKKRKQTCFSSLRATKYPQLRKPHARPQKVSLMSRRFLLELSFPKWSQWVLQCLWILVCVCVFVLPWGGRCCPQRQGLCLWSSYWWTWQPNWHPVSHGASLSESKTENCKLHNSSRAARSSSTEWTGHEVGCHSVEALWDGQGNVETQ